MLYQLSWQQALWPAVQRQQPFGNTMLGTLIPTWDMKSLSACISWASYSSSCCKLFSSDSFAWAVALALQHVVASTDYENNCWVTPLMPLLGRLSSMGIASLFVCKLSSPSEFVSCIIVLPPTYTHGVFLLHWYSVQEVEEVKARKHIFHQPILDSSFKLGHLLGWSPNWGNIAKE
jgi:hypothetical protein